MGRDGPATRWLCRAVIAAFLLGVGWWGGSVGMRVREQVWTCSRSIRFHNDVRNAMRWGDRVLRTAEAMAGEGGRADVAVTRRPLTLGEIVRGEGRVYDDLLAERPDNDYQLDYPPLRLLTMSLWTRAVQARLPGVRAWPGPYHLVYSGTGDPGALVTEDVAGPLLRLNAVAEGMTSLLAFGLVWLWVDRGGRSGPAWRRAARPHTPLRRANGLVLFPVAATAFLYAVSVAVSPSPAPPPVVAVAGPAVVTGEGPLLSAHVMGSIDPQGTDARWHVEWGLAAGAYDHVTPDRRVDGGGAGATDVSADVTGLPAGATVHYRLVARNDRPFALALGSFGRGTSRSDDATLIATAGVQQPAPPSGTVGAVWLSLPQWLGVGLLYAVTCGAMRVLPAEHRGWAAGLVAAGFIWFDPSLLVDAHVWPQWDVWVLPPFLLAALLASLDWWLAAGLVMGVGAMFKGQFLLGAPVLIVWPLLSLRWGAVARLLSGFALMAGLIVSPWLVLNEQPPSMRSGPLRWIVAVAVAAGLGAILSLYRGPASRAARRLWEAGRHRRWRASRPEFIGPAPPPPPAAGGGGLFAAAVLVTVAIGWLLVVHPWPADAELPRAWGKLLLLVVLVPPWLLRRRSLGVWAAALVATAVWCGGSLYHGDWSWKTVGFEYGTRKFDHLSMSHGQGSNLGTILERGFGWSTHDPMFTFRPPDVAGLFYAGRPATAVPQWLRAASLDGSAVTLDVRTSLLVLYGVGVLIASAGAAIQDRRGDPRFLAALVAPWMLMPNVLAQMMSRYELWGAVLSSMLVAISSGLGLVHVAVSLLAAGMIGVQLLNYDPSRSPQVQRLMTGLGTDDAWVLLASAALVLFVAIVPGRRRAADLPRDA
jgi:hypothetical protein